MSDTNLSNEDCISYMQNNIINKKTYDLTLTDIPYDAVNRSSNGLRNLDKGKADELNFSLSTFLDLVYQVTNGISIVFCSKEQFSTIYKFFADKSGTTRPIVWHKSNPSPMNGQYVYLSGVEMAVWFKKKGHKTFNAHCKNSVFKHPNGRSKLHPTEKNHSLLEELILDNSNVGDTVFDPCMGSGSHGLVAKNLGRNFYGTELDKSYFEIARERLMPRAHQLRRRITCNNL